MEAATSSYSAPGNFSQYIYSVLIDQILSYISFCFEIRAHLGHLFAQPPKIIKFNRLYCLKNEPSTKLNHIFTV